MITLDQLQKFLPNTSIGILNKYVAPTNSCINYYNINTINRRAAFLAQIAHESGGFKFVEENLNYSAEGLLRVFPNYFNSSTALEYARKPEKIANRVYANRLGNSNEASGDGWKYKGRGTIQLTGKTNYQAFATDKKRTLEDTISYLQTPNGALDSAGWFWQKRNLNSYADNDDIKTITKIINGGYIGLDERTKLYESAKKIFTTS